MIAVKRQEELREFESGVVLKTVRLESGAFDMAEFVRWADALEKPPQKKRLLQLTLFSHRPISEHIKLSYKQLAMSQEVFLSKLNQNLGNAAAAFHKEWYSYADASHTYIDFANAYIFGGGWRGGGNVQEETLFCEFFQLALLAYLSEAAGAKIRPASGSPELQNAEPTPFFVENMVREFRISPALYGQALTKVSPDEIPRYVESIAPQEQPSVAIAGIAARAWSAPGMYSEKDLLYHLKAAYLAFMGEKWLHPDASRVHTGLWGCGVFHNSRKMMLAIQLLAARMAEVEIHFWGAGEDGALADAVAGFHSAKEGVHYLLEQQKSDPLWKPFEKQMQG